MVAVTDHAADDALWTGAPDVPAYTFRLWLPGAVVGAIAAAVGIAWEWSSIADHHLLVYWFAGGVFLALAVYALPVRALLLVRTARACSYSITPEHVEFRTGGHERFALPAADLPPWTLVPSPDGGQADVVFIVEPEHESLWGAWRLVDKRPRFQCLHRTDAERAAAVLDELRKMEA